MDNQPIVIKAEGISKRYGGVQALNQVNFELRRGEVHALMGENGAGKSTLAKIISGIEIADSGQIFLEGSLVKFNSPSEAIESGVAIVLQEFNVIPDLSVAENIFLNHKNLYKANMLIDKRKMARKTEELLDLFAMKDHIDPYSKVSSLSIAEIQIIEVLKAVAVRAKVIFLDEPTAALSPTEVSRLFSVIRRLQADGVSFVIVSHRFNEIYEISNRITVFRDGTLVLSNQETKTFEQNDLVKAMVGREIKDLYGTRQHKIDQKEMVLEVKGLSDEINFVQNVSFRVYKGEIVGIAGLVGSGRTELVRSIFGVDSRSKGEVSLCGTVLQRKRPKQSIANGLAFVPEDRKNDGLLLSVSIINNISLAKLSAEKGRLVSRSGEVDDCLSMVEKLRIKIGDYLNPVGSLSGGNQQKVLLGKWLLTNPKLLIVDEPTRGIDISAKSEIYSILNELADQGVSILMVSSELPEILGMCDRILIMRDGHMVKELQAKEASEETILHYASLGAKEASGQR